MDSDPQPNDDDAAAPPPEASVPEAPVPEGAGPDLESASPVYGPLYYLVRNVGRMIWAKPVARRALTVLPPLFIVVAYLGRIFLYSQVIAWRKRSPWVITTMITMALLVIAGCLGPQYSRQRLFLIVPTVAVWLILALLPHDLYRELSLYQAYSRIERVPLKQLPLTDKERIYPLAMVNRVVEDRLTQSHFTVSGFELVSLSGELFWIAQKTPAGTVNRATMADIEGLVRVPASQIRVDIEHVPVRFAQGRDLIYLKDLGRFVLPGRMRLIDLFDKEIDVEDVTYLTNDKGDWVQVVALIDWQGWWPFCYPEFGGVFVCPQKDKGDIQFYTPEQLAATPWLSRQNLLPEPVSTFYAESWKFNQGFIGWLRHQGVTKITTIPEDTNQQPFTVYFKDVNGQEGLFHFFALEPDGRSAGLSKMLLVEPWGHQRTVRIFFYDFDVHGDSLVGPARIAETIKGSDLHADWKQQGSGTFVIAESRPYLREHEGKRSFHWFNSIITEGHGSNLPIIVIADPKTLDVKWYEGDKIKELLGH